MCAGTAASLAWPSTLLACIADASSFLLSPIFVPSALFFHPSFVLWVVYLVRQCAYSCSNSGAFPYHLRSGVISKANEPLEPRSIASLLNPSSSAADRSSSGSGILSSAPSPSSDQSSSNYLRLAHLPTDSLQTIRCTPPSASVHLRITYKRAS